MSKLNLVRPPSSSAISTAMCSGRKKSVNLKTANALGLTMPLTRQVSANEVTELGGFAALHESAFDAVDGSSTGTEVPWMWVLLRPLRLGGAKYANGQDDRSRYC